MNILEKYNFYKQQYEELDLMFDVVDSYLSGYDIEDKSVDEMIEEFFYVFGKYNITNKDFICIAKSLGYDHRQVSVNGKRFYTLVKE